MVSIKMCEDINVEHESFKQEVISHLPIVGIVLKKFLPLQRVKIIILDNPSKYMSKEDEKYILQTYSAEIRDYGYKYIINSCVGGWFDHKSPNSIFINVNFFKNRKETSVQHMIIHEMGHMIQDHYYGSETAHNMQKINLNSIQKELFSPSEYAQTNIGEMEAEALAKVFLSKSTINKFKLIKHCLGNILSIRKTQFST